jgi:hypothetical protein
MSMWLGYLSRLLSRHETSGRGVSVGQACITTGTAEWGNLHGLAGLHAPIWIAHE